ncbi:MAG: glutaredoxin domain-containing protein, partial [Candidatus Bathyarchaeia archaeon]
MVKVKIYTAPNCPYCKALKKFLKENNVPFEERDVSKDPKAVTELILKSNQTLFYTKEPESYPYRPSVDVFFKSAIKYFSGNIFA